MPPPVVGEACLTAPPPASKYATCSMLKCKSSLSLHFCSFFFPSLSVLFSFSLPPYFVWFLFIWLKQMPYLSLVLCVSSSKKHEVYFISLKFLGRLSLNLMLFNGTPEHVMGILFCSVCNGILFTEYLCIFLVLHSMCSVVIYL